MTIALSLLISAMQLLTMVQANPNLPPAFVAEVEIIANQAITTAKEEIAKAQATTTTPTQPATVVNNYYTAPEPTQSPMGAPVIESAPVVAVSIETNSLPPTTFGGNCELKEIIVSGVKYSDGSLRQEVVTGNFPNGSIATGTRFAFKTPTTIETTETVRLSFGALTKDFSFNIRPWIVSASMVDSNNKFLPSTGMDSYYNPSTYQCY